MYLLGLLGLCWYTIRMNKKRTRELNEWYNKHGIF